MPTIEEVLEAIRVMDREGLRQIQSTVKFRSEQLTAGTRNLLVPGDRVKIGQSINPKYMRGKTATIVRVNTKRVVLDFDYPQGRFFKGFTCPISCIERLGVDA